VEVQIIPQVAQTTGVFQAVQVLLEATEVTTVLALLVVAVQPLQESLVALVEMAYQVALAVGEMQVAEPP
jgi:hypothetical protein